MMLTKSALLTDAYHSPLRAAFERKGVGSLLRRTICEAGEKESGVFATAEVAFELDKTPDPFICA